MNTKQTASMTAIVSGIAARVPAVDPKFEVVEDKGNAYLIADQKLVPAWPDIKLGKQGGIQIPAVSAYADPLVAAINADTLYAKQEARRADNKAKAEAAKAAPVAAAPVVVNHPAPSTPAPSGPVLVKGNKVTGFTTGEDAVDQEEEILSDLAAQEEQFDEQGVEEETTVA